MVHIKSQLAPHLILGWNNWVGMQTTTGSARSRMFEPTHCFTTGRSTSLEAFLRLRPTCWVHQGPKSSVATHLSQMKGIITAECITACRTSFGCSPRGLIPTKRLNTTSATAINGVGYAVSLQGAGRECNVRPTKAYVILEFPARIRTLTPKAI